MFSKPKQRNHLLHRTTRRLGLEGLEDRNLMVGNVMASLGSDGVLQITGDDAGNGVSVRQVIGTASYEVVGLNRDGAPTLVNNRASSQYFPNVRGLRADMRGGSDHVDIGSGDAMLAKYTPRTNFFLGVNVNTGSGADEVSIKRVDTYYDVNVRTDSGSDTVTVYNTQVGSSEDDFRQGDLYVWSGSGSDSVSIRDSRVVGTLYVNPTGGLNDSDSVDMLRTSVGLNLTIMANNMFVTTGQLTSSLKNVTVARTLTIGVPSTQASVVLDTVSADRILATMGNGNDELSLMRVTARSMEAHGGAGYDRLLLYSNDWYSSVLDGFEHHAYSVDV